MWYTNVTPRDEEMDVSAELINQEASIMGELPCEAWSREGALWNEGYRGTSVLEVLVAERKAREAFTPDVVAKLKGELR